MKVCFSEVSVLPLPSIKKGMGEGFRVQIRDFCMKPMCFFTIYLLDLTKIMYLCPV